MMQLRPVIVEHGMWDQLRVDGGREFYLILHVQEMLSAHRTNVHRPAFVQTPSTEVNVLCFSIAGQAFIMSILHSFRN